MASTQRRLKALEAKIQRAMDAAAKQQAGDAEWLNTPPLHWFIVRKADGVSKRVDWQPWMGSMASINALMDEMDDVESGHAKFGQRSLPELRDIYNAIMRQRPRTQARKEQPHIP